MDTLAYPQSRCKYFHEILSSFSFFSTLFNVSKNLCVATAGPNKRSPKTFHPNIRLPIWHKLVSENFLQFILQTAERHVKQEEYPCRKEIYEPEQKSRTICMLKSLVHAYTLSPQHIRFLTQIMSKESFLRACSHAGQHVEYVFILFSRFLDKRCQ